LPAYPSLLSARPYLLTFLLAWRLRLSGPPLPHSRLIWSSYIVVFSSLTLIMEGDNLYADLAVDVAMGVATEVAVKQAAVFLAEIAA